MTDKQLSRIEDLKNRRGLKNSASLDSEYGAAFYLFTCNRDLFNRVKGYVNKDGIDFPQILNGTYSHGEGTLLRLANNLFNNGAEVSPVELCRTLDDDLFSAAMAAIRIRRS